MLTAQAIAELRRRAGVSSLDAVHATRAAVEEGVVLGGGVALLALCALPHRRHLATAAA